MFELDEVQVHEFDTREFAVDEPPCAIQAKVVQIWQYPK